VGQARVLKEAQQTARKTLLVLLLLVLLLQQQQSWPQLRRLWTQTRARLEVLA
jgi:hypothetical protein